MRLSEAGELGLLGELERRGLIVGTEHDAAELEGGLVVTQDALVEDVHFRFDLLSWHELGFRAAAVNVSDLSASAAAPEALLVTLAVPPETALERVVELYEGIAEGWFPCAARRHDERARRRAQPDGASAGRSESRAGGSAARRCDRHYGQLGAAGAAVSARAASRLLRSRTARRPSARPGRAAMLDVSDGLAVRRGPTSRGAPAAARDRPRRGSRSPARLDDLGFGEDFELTRDSVPNEPSCLKQLGESFRSSGYGGSR
jgi:hypothetical protein